MLLTEPSGNLFGLTQNAGMGWDPNRLLDPEFLILSTHGGLRAENGEAIALGFHAGHWEVGLLVAEAARELLPNRYPYVSEFQRALQFDPKNLDLRRELAGRLPAHPIHHQEHAALRVRPIAVFVARAHPSRVAGRARTPYTRG